MTTTAVASTLPEEILSIVEHLHGDLYQAPLDAIQYAEDIEKEEISFYNPRHSSDKDGKLVAKGFSKEEMADLRKDIQRSGLNDPLLVRPINVDGKWKLQLVDGERRKRSLDALVKKNEKCYDPFTGTDVPAADLYATVNCRIRVLDERAAFRQAVAANATSVDIGEGATLNLVRILRGKGADDDYLREVINKSPSWIRETDKLLSLDEQTFTALCQDNINRRVALSLADEEDIKTRLERLEKLTIAAQERLNRIKTQAKAKSAEAEETLEEAEAVAAVVEAVGGDVTKSKKSLAAAKEKVEKRRKNLARVEKKKPKATGKDVEAVEGVNKSLTKTKMKKYWHDSAAAIIKNKFANEDGDPIEGVDAEDVHLIVLLYNKFEAGERDVVRILKQHSKNKERRAGK